MFSAQKSVVADGIRSAWRILFAIVRVKELSGQYSEVQSCSLVTFAFFSRHTRGLFAAQEFLPHPGENLKLHSGI